MSIVEGLIEALVDFNGVREQNKVVNLTKTVNKENIDNKQLEKGMN